MSKYERTLAWLKSKWEPGMTAADLAKAAYVSRSAITRYRERLKEDGYPLRGTCRFPKPGTPDFERAMDDLAAQVKPGEGSKSFYKRIGMCKTTFYKVLPELTKRSVTFSCKRQWPEWRKEAAREKRRKVIALYNAGFSNTIIADKTGYTRITVKDYTELYKRGEMTEDGRIMGEAQRKDVPKPEDSDHRVDA